MVGGHQGIRNGKEQIRGLVNSIGGLLVSSIIRSFLKKMFRERSNFYGEKNVLFVVEDFHQLFFMSSTRFFGIYMSKKL